MKRHNKKPEKPEIFSDDEFNRAVEKLSEKTESS
jgi:hypothetical protein